LGVSLVVTFQKKRQKKNRFAWKNYSKFDYFTDIWLQKSQKIYIQRFNIVKTIQFNILLNNSYIFLTFNKFANAGAGVIIMLSEVISSHLKKNWLI
jgi:hypothetical protein